MKRSRTRRVPMSAAALVKLGNLGAVVALLGPAGCFASNDGPEPPADGFYFPTALATSPGGKALYVVNSNFDLQYTGGTVQALDLEALRAAVPKLWLANATDAPNATCEAYGLRAREPADQVLQPGVCSPIDLNAPPGGGRILRSSVSLGAFASDARLLTAPCKAPLGSGQSSARLAVVVRGDPSLTWLDVEDDRTQASHAQTCGDGGAGFEAEPEGGDANRFFRLDCDQASSDGRCGASHLAGRDPNENLRALTLPTEPFAISPSQSGSALAVTHQAGGFVSLFVNGWPGNEAKNEPPKRCPASKSYDSPQLAFVLGGLQGRATSVAALPVPRFVRRFGDVAYRPTFLVAYRDLPQVDRLLYFDDCASSPDRPFLGYGGSTRISVAAAGFDSRGIAIDPSARQACENACGEADRPCQEACAGVPIKVYVASRTPASLLIGETSVDVTATGSTDLVRFYDIVSLSPGVSGVQVGSIIDVNGVRRTRVFVTCFDARFVYVYDPERNAIEGIVRTGRGPNTIAFDPSLDATSGVDFAPGSADPRAETGAFAYLAHFTDSYLGVIDLNQQHASTYLTMVATVGTPRPPRDSRLRHAPSEPPLRRLRRLHPRARLRRGLCPRRARRLGLRRLHADPDPGAPPIARSLGARRALLRRQPDLRRPLRQHGSAHGQLRERDVRERRRPPALRRRRHHAAERAARLRARDAADARRARRHRFERRPQHHALGARLRSLDAGAQLSARRRAAGRRGREPLRHRRVRGQRRAGPPGHLRPAHDRVAQP